MERDVKRAKGADELPLATRKESIIHDSRMELLEEDLRAKDAIIARLTKEVRDAPTHTCPEERDAIKAPVRFPAVPTSPLLGLYPVLVPLYSPSPIFNTFFLPFLAFNRTKNCSKS